MDSEARPAGEGRRDVRWRPMTHRVSWKRERKRDVKKSISPTLGTCPGWRDCGARQNSEEGYRI